MRLLVAALFLSAVIVLGFAASEARFLVPQPSNGPAQGVVWRGRTFATRAEFARWLRSHGVSYRVWARSHPVQAGLDVNGGRHSNRGAWRLAAVAAFLATLALGLVFVRRRWPKSDAYAAHLLEIMAVRSVAAITAGARMTRRYAALTAQRSTAFAIAGTARARTGTGVFAALLEIVTLRTAAAINGVARTTRRRAARTAQRSAARGTAASTRARAGTGPFVARWLEIVTLRGAAAARAGARTTRRRAARTAQRSAARGTAASTRARAGTGPFVARWLEIVTLRGAAAAKAGARTTRRWAALTARRSAAVATATTSGVRRQRSELLWYMTMALLVAGIGVVLTVSLNGG
jgi:hypothetical protein